MSLELTPDIIDILTGLQATIDGMRAELTAVHAQLRAKPSGPAEPREWYSVEEVAEAVGKRPYSVREWARLGRINAVKRAERRGGSALWSISAEEVRRYREKGLLPIDPDRNNLN